MAGLVDIVKTLLGISAYEYKRPPMHEPEAKTVEAARIQRGGDIEPLPDTRTRWMHSDIESAILSADTGDMRLVGVLSRSMLRDGQIAGLMSTCTDGLVRLPKRFYGRDDMVEALSDRTTTYSEFDLMCPPSELALLAADGRVCGVGVGELVPVDGRDFPIFVRHSPEFLTYRRAEGRWYFRSISGLLPITPGDGRWVLHAPGGHWNPWQNGIWMALATAWVDKLLARSCRSNYIGKLANPARVAYSPPGATEVHREGMLSRLIAWGVNTCMELPLGWDVKLLESNGNGADVFKDAIADANTEFQIAIAGQVVTTTGGTGFANADIHKSIRADIIKSIADALAFTINTQILPYWTVAKYGPDALSERPTVEWDVSPPKDMKIEADARRAAAEAIDAVATLLGKQGLDIDALSYAQAMSLPASPAKQSAEIKSAPAIELAPTDVAKVVRVDEARLSQGLPPIGDERGVLTITELTLLSSQPQPTQPEEPDAA